LLPGERALRPREPTFETMLAGATELIAWCGGWPNFHDAEIVRLDLHRRGVSRLVIAVRGGEKPNFGPRSDRRYAVPPADVLITFFFEDIEDLELTDFSRQNVVFELDLTCDQGVVTLEMSPCFGLAGKIVARKVTVEFSPGSAPDAE